MTQARIIKLDPKTIETIANALVKQIPAGVSVNGQYGPGVYPVNLQHMYRHVGQRDQNKPNPDSYEGWSQPYSFLRARCEQQNKDLEFANRTIPQHLNNMTSFSFSHIPVMYGAARTVATQAYEENHGGKVQEGHSSQLYINNIGFETGYGINCSTMQKVTCLGVQAVVNVPKKNDPLVKGTIETIYPRNCSTSNKKKERDPSTVQDIITKIANSQSNHLNQQHDIPPLLPPIPARGGGSVGKRLPKTPGGGAHPTMPRNYGATIPKPIGGGRFKHRAYYHETPIQNMR